MTTPKKKAVLPSLRAGRWCREVPKGTVLYIVDVDKSDVSMSYGPGSPIAVRASRSDFQTFFKLIREPVNQPKLMPRSRAERKEQDDDYTAYRMHVVGCVRCSRAASRIALCSEGQKLVARVFGPARPIEAQRRQSTPPDIDGQSAALAAAHAYDPPPGAPDYRKRLRTLETELAALGAEAFEGGRARGRLDRPPPRFEFEGVVRFHGLLDDTATAGIMPVGNDTCVGLSGILQSYDRRKEHTEARSINGKRVRVTVEIL